MLSPVSIDETTAKSVAATARYLVGKTGLTSQDLPDIQQDLTLDLLQRLPSLDEGRAAKSTFVFNLLAHKAANILRDRQRACRDRNKESALPTLSETERDSSTSPVVDFDAGTAYQPFGWQRRSEQDSWELAHDFDQVLSSLSPFQQRLCSLLTEHSISVVATRLGVCRDTVYRHLHQLREVFEAAGLKEYFS